MANTSPGRVLRLYWPLAISPIGLLIGFTLPVLVLSLNVSPAIFLNSWRQPYFITPETIAIAVASIFLFAIPQVAFKKPPLRMAEISLSEKTTRNLHSAAVFMGYFSVGIYLFWFALALSRGLSFQTIVAAVAGDGNALASIKLTYFATLAGITTFSQLATVSATLLVLLVKLGVDRNRKLIYLLTFFVLARSFLLTERLALIEMAVPIGVVIATTSAKISKALDGIKGLILFVSGTWLSLIAVFGGFEYFRSWGTFYSRFESDFFSFITTRLLGYYATALNNAALANQRGTFDLNLWALTGISSDTSKKTYWRDLLSDGSNAEFNNISGLLSPINAFGIVGGLCVLLAIGMIVALVYKQANSGSLSALLGYSFLSVGILELVRLFYFSISRSWPIWAGIALVSIVLQNSVSVPSKDHYRYRFSDKNDITGK